ncbi:MAG: anthranilate phosphoribosyltransferase [Rickettsiales bacterium]|nr:anthranilate phosphoribosyltransferase [Rickettsiales bacterium]
MNLSQLTSQNFEEIFSQIIELKFSENEIKKILLDLNQANLPQNAFIGAISALKKSMKIISAPQNAIDVCGTGGDKLKTLNVSTAVCFVVAGAKIPVAKHGNKAISSNSGSADIFLELGIKFSENISEIEKNLREKNLCFLFAPLFYPALKNISEIRKSIGVPTIFNFLGPLLNPANTRFQLIGTSKKDVMKKMLSTKKETAEKIYLIHGFDGMDEITLTDNSYLMRLENGKIFDEEIIDPTQFGFKKIGLEALQGKDAKYNAQKLIALLEGEKSAYRDIVILNSAFAFKLVEKVKNIEEGIDLAAEVIDYGLAKKVLQSIKN